MTEFAGHQTARQDHVLLHELNHRINNEFSAAISVVSLAAARSDNSEVKTALSEVTELLHRYADVHRALQVPEYDVVLQAEMYLRQLCLAISRSYLDPRKIKLVLATEPLRLEADRCWRLGMIVYELIVNSARHAFFGSGGQIRVELTRAGAIAQCSIVDTGFVPATAAPGRGLKIVDELSKGLGGRFVQKFGPRGSRSLVVFPCDSERGAIATTARKGAHTSGAIELTLESSPSTVPC